MIKTNAIHMPKCNVTLFKTNEKILPCKES